MVDEYDDVEMQDTAERRRDRKFITQNRKERRRMAKRAKLFKDRTGGAWRTANKHMKEKEQEFRNPRVRGYDE